MINIKIDNSVKCNGDKSMFLAFPYDDKIVNCIRRCGDRAWDSKTKLWEVSMYDFANLMESLTEYDIRLTADFTPAKEDDMENIDIDFNFKTQPFSHQVTAFKFGITHNKWLLGDEMGLGKSKSLIDLAVYKKQTEAYKHCLVICGVNSLKWNWKKEVEIHSNESAWVLGNRDKGQISNYDKMIDAMNLEDNPNYFIITNVESFRDDDITTEIARQIKLGNINMVALDEAHKIKNPQSQQCKGLLKIQAECMVAMTGTPLMNNPLDLFVIFKWLGYENHSFYQFKNHYCTMGGYGGYEIVGYKNMGELRSRLNSIMLRRKKEEVLDLPEKIYIDEYVEMTRKQLNIYREIKEEIVENIDKIKMSNNPLAELIRLRQASGYPGILSSTVTESAKLDRLEEIVEEAVANNTKVVIFSNWTQMTDPVASRLKKYNPVQITGQTNDTDRVSIVEKFQTDSNCKVCIGTIGAMGTGLTLTAGTVEVFLDEPWNNALKEQCVDRCHRIGQKSSLTIYTLMSKGTIDEKIHSIVLQKGEISDIIVDSKTSSDYKSELIDCLLSD